MTNPIAPMPYATNAPIADLSSPTNGSSFTAPSSITVTADASSAAGVAQVNFFLQNPFGFPDPIGDTLIGTATNAPYSISWTSIPSGTNSIVAQVIDNNGNVAITPTVTITVSP